MNWKEFLKPTKRKIIAYVITLVLVFVYSLYALPCPVYGPGGGLLGASTCGELPSEGLILLAWPSMLAISFLSQLGTLTANVEYMIYINLLFRIFVFVLGIIGNLFYLYVISTLILKLIEKFKSRSGA